jgi:hypothetical protein
LAFVNTRRSIIGTLSFLFSVKQNEILGLKNCYFSLTFLLEPYQNYIYTYNSKNKTNHGDQTEDVKTTGFQRAADALE